MMMIGKCWFAMRKHSARLRSDRRGTAAVEAAIIFPILVFLFLGMTELYLYLQASSRVTTAAEFTADLITKVKQVNGLGAGDTATVPSMNTIFSAANFMLLPFSASSTNTSIEAASIIYAAPAASNDVPPCGQATCPAVKAVDWDCKAANGSNSASCVKSGATGTVTSTNVYQNYVTGCAAGNLVTCYCVLDPSSLPGTANKPPTCETNQSTVYVTISYAYSNPIAWFVAKSPTITANAFLRPRLVFYVPLCTSSTDSSTCQ